MKQNVISNINELIAGIKKHGGFLLIGSVILAGILLFSSFFNDSKPTPKLDKEQDTETYLVALERKLKSFLEQIEGIGKCDIMITLESGVEYIYAIENNNIEDTSYDKDNIGEKTQKKTDNEVNYKIIREGNSEKPIIIKEINPVIKGVAVVCQGGGSAGVKNMIIETISTLLGITGDKISITKKR